MGSLLSIPVVSAVPSAFVAVSPHVHVPSQTLLGPEGAKSFAQEPQTRQGVSYDLWRVGPQEATRTPVFRASTESALALSDRA